MWLGEGGMGEVYRARDTKLNRDVAIKVLPDGFANDPERIARLHREAQAVAALNHPNIAAIHDLKESAGTTFLVLELVEGATLAEALGRGRLPLEDTLDIAHQMCEALEAAHEKGIIHLDLKPANVKITPDGRVKVLDFGLAKAMDIGPASGNPADSPTLSLAGSRAGAIVGTAAYMSPEQAKGLRTDQRSDIFSFGCVFYEMLTGRRAFDGEAVSDVLASVLKSEPDLNLLPDDLNPRIKELLRRCLEKNPRRRWYAIGDVRLEIETIRTSGMAAVVTEPQIVRPRAAWKRVVPALLLTLIAGALAVAGTWYFRPSTPRSLARLQLTLDEGQLFTNVGRQLLAISADGTQMVYVANRQLFHKSMKEFEVRPIPGTEEPDGVSSPVFSPDGRSVMYFSIADSKLKKIAVVGGAAISIVAADVPFGVSWSTDGIVFGQGSKGIVRVSENGERRVVLVSVKDGEMAGHPQLLPGGQAVLFTLATRSSVEPWDNAQVIVQSLTTGNRTPLNLSGSDARYVPTGHIVYALGGTLFAVPFDSRSLKVTGVQVPVVEGVLRAAPTGAAQYSFSDTGSLTYIPGPVAAAGAQLVLARMDRTGAVEPLKVPPRSYGFPRVSPDRKHIAFGIEDSKGANIWVYDTDGKTDMRPLTVAGANRYPIWSADGERVAFQSDREGDLGIWWQRQDGSGSAERLTKPTQGVAHIPDSWLPNSPDNQRFSFTEMKGGEGAVWIFSIRDTHATRFEEMPSQFVGLSAFSPDGQWLAYQSTRSGVNRIWVQPFPATGEKHLINGNSGAHPFWAQSNGNELFFGTGSTQLSVVRINTKPSFTIGVPAAVPTSLGMKASPAVYYPRNFDITRHGEYFVIVTGAVAAPQIRVVLNWFDELKQRMSVAR